MSSEVKGKVFREAFANFFDSPSRDTLRQLLFDNTGEDNSLDFKTEITKAPVIAKDMLGMANKSGGAIIFGVKEVKKEGMFDPVGLPPTLWERTEFETAINKYIFHNKPKYCVIDLSYKGSEYEKLIGKNFRVVIVEHDPRHIPYMARQDGEGINKREVYIRDASSTIKAEYDHLQDIFNRRLESGFSSARELSLKEHFDELKELYSLISKGTWVDISDYNYFDPYEDFYRFEENSKYPKEDFDDFVLRMIKLKKSVIEAIVRTDKYLNRL